MLSLSVATIPAPNCRPTTSPVIVADKSTPHPTIEKLINSDDKVDVMYSSYMYESRPHNSKLPTKKIKFDTN